MFIFNKKIDANYVFFTNKNKQALNKEKNRTFPERTILYKMSKATGRGDVSFGEILSIPQLLSPTPLLFLLTLYPI
jgi:hypothetical protein